MKIRNAIYKNEANTIVDVEIEHPKFGWIPYTFKDDELDESFDSEVREYLLNAVISDYIFPTQEELDLIELNRQKEIKKELLGEITVTTANGNTFDGDDVARVDMLNAILASETLGLTEHPWKLANNEWVTIQIEELKEASALAIMRKGEILAG